MTNTVKIRDSNGTFIELSAEEFHFALLHGLGVVKSLSSKTEEMVREDPKELKKINMRIGSLMNILRKIRPDHLIIETF